MITTLSSTQIDCLSSLGSSSGTCSSVASFCLSFCLYFYVSGRLVMFPNLREVVFYTRCPVHPSSILPSCHPNYMLEKLPHEGCACPSVVLVWLCGQSWRLSCPWSAWLPGPALCRSCQVLAGRARSQGCRCKTQWTLWLMLDYWQAERGHGAWMQSIGILQLVLDHWLVTGTFLTQLGPGSRVSWSLGWPAIGHGQAPVDPRAGSTLLQHTGYIHCGILVSLHLSSVAWWMELCPGLSHW